MILPWSIWPKAIWFTFKYSILGVSISQYQPWVMGISASADSWHSNTHQHQPSLAKRGVADKNLVQWHLSFLNPDSHSLITSWPALPQLAPISWSVFPIPLPHFHLIWPQYFHLIWPGHVSNMFWVMACAPPSHTSKREKISFHILRQRSPIGSSQTSFPMAITEHTQIKSFSRLNVQRSNGWWVLDWSTGW